MTFVEFVKTYSCSICGTSPVDAHHLDTVGMGRNRKNDCIEDYSCVPLCREHHQEWHQVGDTEFTNKYYINLWKINYLINKHWKQR